MQTAHNKSNAKKKTKIAFGVQPSHRTYRLRLARYIGMTEAITDFLNEKQAMGGKPLRLLDIGPGSGRSLRYCQTAGIDDRLEFHGLEKSEHRRQGIYEPSRWNLLSGDAEERFPFPSEHFDICVCEQVLEHLTRPDAAIDEMLRVLRPGGLMLIGVPTFPPGIAHVRAWIVPRLDRLFGLTRSHPQTFTSRRIAAMLCSNHPLQLKACRGFRVVSGGILSWLEDYQWWYRTNRWIGRTFPWLCTEVQLVLKKTDARL